jgi:hypothetical protein
MPAAELYQWGLWILKTKKVDGDALNLAIERYSEKLGRGG